MRELVLPQDFVGNGLAGLGILDRQPFVNTAGAVADEPGGHRHAGGEEAWQLAGCHAALLQVAANGHLSADEVGHVTRVVCVDPVLGAEVEELQSLLEVLQVFGLVPQTEGIELAGGTVARVLDAECRHHGAGRTGGEQLDHGPVVAAWDDDRKCRYAATRGRLGQRAPCVGKEPPGDQIHRLGIALEQRCHRQARVVEHHQFDKGVGDVHRVGGRAPVNMLVVAEHDPRQAGEAAAEDIQSGCFEAHRVERRRGIQLEVGVIGNNRQAVLTQRPGDTPLIGADRAIGIEYAADERRFSQVPCGISGHFIDCRG